MTCERSFTKHPYGVDISPQTTFIQNRINYTNKNYNFYMCFQYESASSTPTENHPAYFSISYTNYPQIDIIEGKIYFEDKNELLNFKPALTLVSKKCTLEGEVPNEIKLLYSELLNEFSEHIRKINPEFLTKLATLIDVKLNTMEW